MEEEEIEDSFFKRYRVAIIAGTVVLAGLVGYFVFGKRDDAPKRTSTVSMVSIMPPPPPPPTPPPTPPPPTPPPPEEQPKEEEFQAEEKPVDEKPEPPKPEEPPPLGTNIKGNGNPDGFGLSGNGNGGGLGGGGKGGTRFGWYAGQVQGKIAEALRNNRKTKSASMNIKIRVWPDSSGRITRVTLEGSTGDPKVDAAIKNEILNGLQLQPPPQDMPLPIVMRVNAKRPN